VGYTDVDNNDFTLHGYRFDGFSLQSNASFRFQMLKVQDDGGKKMSLVFMEDIGFESGGMGDQVIDHIRTGINDRSYDPSSERIWSDLGAFTWKQADFSSYFLGDENKIEGRSKDEGIIIRISREAGEFNTVDWLSLQIKYSGSIE
jgi:hypothetical protein